MNTSRYFRNERRGLGALGEWEIDTGYYSGGANNNIELVSEPVSFTDAGFWFPQATSVAVAAPAPDATSWFKAYLEPTIASARDIATAYVGIKTQADLNAINMERVKRGQQPLSASTMQAMAPQVNVGLSAQSRQLLIYGALGLGAMFAISQFTKRRS